MFVKKVRFDRVVTIVIVLLILYVVIDPWESVVEFDVPIHGSNGSASLNDTIMKKDGKKLPMLILEEEPLYTIIGGDLGQELSVISKYTAMVGTPGGGTLRPPFMPSSEGKYTVKLFNGTSLFLNETVLIRDSIVEMYDNQLSHSYDTNFLTVITRFPVMSVSVNLVNISFDVISSSENSYTYHVPLLDYSAVYSFQSPYGWLFNHYVDFTAPPVTIIGKQLHQPMRIIVNRTFVDVVLHDINRSYDGFGFVYGDGFVETVFIPSQLGRHDISVYSDGLLWNSTVYVNEKMEVSLEVGNVTTVSLLNASLGKYDVRVSNGRRTIREEWFVLRNDTVRSYPLSGIVRFEMWSKSTGYYQEEWG